MEALNNIESVRVSEEDTRDFQMFGFKLNINKTYHAYDDAYNTHNTYVPMVALPTHSLIFTHLKLCLATATHNFKWLEIHILQTADQMTRDSAHKNKYLPTKKSALAITHSAVQLGHFHSRSEASPFIGTGTFSQ